MTRLLPTAAFVLLTECRDGSVTMGRDCPAAPR